MKRRLLPADGKQCHESPARASPQPSPPEYFHNEPHNDVQAPTASSSFRNLDPRQSYTGVGEEFPTGTLEEQITRYFHDIGDPPEETLSSEFEEELDVLAVARP
eukprot:g13995.t1